MKNAWNSFKENILYNIFDIEKEREIKVIEAFPTSPHIYLINYSSEHFIVDINPEYDIDWEVKDTWSDEYNKEIQKILNKAGVLECRISYEWPHSVLINAKRMIGEGISRGFSFQFDASQEMFAEAEKFINKKSQEISRYWTLKACIKNVFYLLLIGILTIIFRTFFIGYLGWNFILLVLAACFGGVGALLSVIFRIGDFETQNSAGRSLHRTEGLARIIAGCICGFLAALLIKTGLLLPIVHNTQNINLYILALATIAGVSEKWIPNIILKTAKTNVVQDIKQGEKNEKTSTDNILR